MLGGNSSNEINVRLMASVDDGSFMVPKVGSTIVVSMSSFVEPFAVMYSEIENIIWLGGSYGEVPIVTHPTDANKGLLIKIRNIESLLNHLITNYNAHTHVLTLSAGTGTAATRHRTAARGTARLAGAVRRARRGRAGGVSGGR